MDAKDRVKRGLRIGPVAVLAVLAAGDVAAQEPLGVPEPPAAQEPCICAWGADGPALRAATRINRARLGIQIGDVTEADGRTGLRIGRVEEGGPAARAGLRTGDVLLALDGEDLGDDPAGRLMERLADTRPGDTVAVTFSREGRTRTASVVTDRARGFAFSMASPPRVLRERLSLEAPRVREALVRGLDARRIGALLGGGLELVEMNPGLGEYFGIAEGVLVASVREGSTLALRAGDVIVSIGDRPVRDPAHARAILASYRPDEPITLEVMRERRRITVSGTRGEP